MDNEQPHQELVKCVVVGDTAVGKTRLICARACNKHVSLSQLLTTHVPTVWAIDQYRIYKDVLERSWEVVDGVNVSLRLWDTFGDHDKDRRFAYGRSDVVLLCFSITNPVSLRNCGAMWYPEIRKFCPHTPVLLVGCKNDLRYMYRDETYLSYFRDRSPFVRATRKSDLVMPDQGRALANEIGIYYYETSVFTYYGVNEVFENAIRAALMARKQQRFWMTNLKRVQRPLYQAPFKPPKPLPPEVVIAASGYTEHMTNLFLNQIYNDMVIIAGSMAFPVHRFILAASSIAFHRLLTMDISTHQSSELGARSSSESSMVSSFGEATAGEFNEDTEYLIRQDQSKSIKYVGFGSVVERLRSEDCSEGMRDGKESLELSLHSEQERKEIRTRVWEQMKRRSCQILPSTDCTKKNPDFYKDLNHPAFASIKLIKNELSSTGQVSTQTIVTLSKVITANAIQQCLRFIYTGTLDNELIEMQEIRQAAEFLELTQLNALLTAIQASQQLMNEDAMKLYSNSIRTKLQELCIDRGLFSDITFELDDGTQPAHKAVLVARCDPMKAMFQGDFRESTARIIAFPGVRWYTFHKLLCYLYTDAVPPVAAARCVSLLELANRLCLGRLVNLVEARVMEDLTRVAQSDATEAVDLCIRLLEPVKLHNAHYLAEWCMNHLCINYNKLCKMSPRSVRLLHPENQEYLSENRWPPVWYLKDYDYYQKCCNEQRKEVKPSLKRRQEGARKASGCLCFASWCCKTHRSEATESNPDVSTSLFQSNPNSVGQAINGIEEEPTVPL